MAIRTNAGLLTVVFFSAGKDDEFGITTSPAHRPELEPASASTDVSNQLDHDNPAPIIIETGNFFVTREPKPNMTNGQKDLQPTP